MTDQNREDSEKAIPKEIGGAIVLCFTKIDDRHCRTGATRHFVDGVLRQDFTWLAICRYADSCDEFYLFYCDDHWNTITDTYHASLQLAKQQASFEYEGVDKTW